MRPQIVQPGLASEAGLDEPGAAARARFKDPHTAVTFGQLFLT
jgi:hypothetical protein